MSTLVSIELTNLCAKANLCSAFGCYARAMPDGPTFWKVPVLDAFLRDLAGHGVEAVSFGGGEPLQYPHIWELLEATRDVPLFKSMTTNGLLLKDDVVRRLVGLLEKVHVSIHFPENEKEVARVIGQVLALEKACLRSGINFIVKGANVEAERRAARMIKDAGIGPERVVFLPLHGKGIPLDPERVKHAGEVYGSRFQSTWCLMECRKSERFVSIDWQGRVGWCSYTAVKTPMKQFTYEGMLEALHARELVYCG